MKTKRTKLYFALLVLAMFLVSAAIVLKIQKPNDSCNDSDRSNYNCVPAGKCGPTPELDAIMDCEAKDYDRKYNTKL